MKRLIAAIVTATAISLAACTNPPATEPGPSDETTTTATNRASTPSQTLTSTPSTPTKPPSVAPTSTAARGTTSVSVTGDAYEAIPVDIPATITGADLNAANNAVEVWRNAMRVFDQSLQDPAGKDWKPVIYRYVNDPAALQQMSLINTFVKQGIHQVGDTRYTAKVFEANAHSVKIRTCTDLTSVDYINDAGNSVLTNDERHVRWEFWLGFYTEPRDVWFVSFVDKPKPVQPCSP